MATRITSLNIRIDDLHALSIVNHKPDENPTGHGVWLDIGPSFSLHIALDFATHSIEARLAELAAFGRRVTELAEAELEAHLAKRADQAATVEADA